MTLLLEYNILESLDKKIIKLGIYLEGSSILAGRCYAYYWGRKAFLKI